MKTTEILYLSVKDDVPPTGYWDHQFIKDIFADIPNTDRKVIVIPGAYQWDVIDELNEVINNFEKVLVIITSDEEAKFDSRKLKHDDMVLYSQYGNGGFRFPLGYTPNTKKLLKKFGLVTKSQDWFFSGQITHPRRELMADKLRPINGKGGLLVETDGFAKGLSKEEYLYNMAISKVAPCSPGAVSVDSFRLYEALEAGCIPVADDMSSLQSFRANYWQKLFGDVGFPTFIDSRHITMLIDQSLKHPNMNNKVMAWWINKKHQFKEQLKHQLGVPKDEIVVVIPVSPIPSHPDTAMITETIASIRVHLPEATILVTMDGVRKEQEGMRADYEEFQRKFLWECNFVHKNVLPIIFNYHFHQSGMMKTVLNSIDIPMILYVEHDTPLTPDRPIDWEKCKDYIKSGKSNVIRFHFESKIPEVHEYLMFGEAEDGFRKTAQWSQRPHLASQGIYRIIMKMMSKESNCFIEDFAYGQFETLCREQGIKGWEKWKVHIYHPEGNIKRSYNLDGRKDDPKFIDEQIW